MSNWHTEELERWIDNDEWLYNLSQALDPRQEDAITFEFFKQELESCMSGTLDVYQVNWDQIREFVGL